MIDRGEAIRKVILNGVRWTGLSRLYRALTPRGGAILMLHRVTRSPTSPLGINRHLAIDPDFLDRAIASMKRDGYAFLSMDEIVEYLRGGRGGSPVATLTADDGYRDNMREALPVLESHDAPITVYVAPGLINGSVCLWWNVIEEIIARRDGFYISVKGGAEHVDCSTIAAKRLAYANLEHHLTTQVGELDQDAIVRQLAAASQFDADGPARDLLMNWNELRVFSRHRLVTIGAHTVHHYNLRRLPDDLAAREITDAADIIALELGERPAHMAFPYGYEAAVGGREVKLAAQAGFVTATTTRHGLLSNEHCNDLLALPRISLNGRYQSTGHLMTMLSGITTPIANRGKRYVTV